MPAKTGMTTEPKARAAAAKAIGTAKRLTTRTPTRLMATKTQMISVARSLTSIHGRYQAWSAEAERIAVSPQVGIQPHQ